YKLPRVRQWLSGNIGYHHIHHLSSRIPNYNLERCHNAHPIFQQVAPITWFGSLKSINVRLWDEEGRRLVSFRHVRNRPRFPKSGAAARSSPQDKRLSGSKAPGTPLLEPSETPRGFGARGSCRIWTVRPDRKRHRF